MHKTGMPIVYRLMHYQLDCFRNEAPVEVIERLVTNEGNRRDENFGSDSR